MAKGDIRPFRSTLGGTDNILGLPQSSTATFSEGEPVRLNASGQLIECTDDPPYCAGIAAAPALTSATMGVSGTFTAPVVGTLPSQQFVCFNFATDGAGTAATPTLANAVGRRAGFTLASTTWSVDTGCANLFVTIDGVVDSVGRLINNPTTGAGTGFGVVFHFGP